MKKIIDLYTYKWTIKSIAEGRNSSVGFDTGLDVLAQNNSYAPS